MCGDVYSRDIYLCSENAFKAGFPRSLHRANQLGLILYKYEVIRHQYVNDIRREECVVVLRKKQINNSDLFTLNHVVHSIIH